MQEDTTNKLGPSRYAGLGKQYTRSRYAVRSANSCPDLSQHGWHAIAHWAKQYYIKIKGVMMVAPADLESPFQELTTPIPATTLPFPSVIVASTNDNWATKERTTLFSQNWGSQLIFIGDAGHINTDSGHTNWDAGVEILKTLG